MPVSVTVYTIKKKTCSQTEAVKQHNAGRAMQKLLSRKADIIEK